MSIREVLSKQLNNTKINHKHSFLNPGQIVQGKIVKLYPNNKAQIQIGSHKMIAQLEASLIIGENYHFQVKSNADVTHLKVVGDQLKRNVGENMRMLVQELGMKATKANITLMEQLMENKVPFDREDLMKASQLLEGTKNKGQAQSIIKEMLVHKLPLTNAIFQALYTKAVSGFSEQMNGLLHQLKQEGNQSPLNSSLIKSLTTLTESPLSNERIVSKHILSELEANQTHLFIMAKTTGLVKEDVNLATWSTEWKNFVKNNPYSVLPFDLNATELLQELKHTVKNEDRIIKQTRTIEQQFSSLLNRSNIHQNQLFSEVFKDLETQIETKLLPLMSDKQQLQIRTLLQNNSTSLKQLGILLKTLSNEQTYTQMESLIRNANRSDAELISKPHEIFLTHVKQVLQSTGLSHEFDLTNDSLEKQNTTIKSMILQLVQQSDGATNERAQQLLHFINGMQIQSVTDTTNFLQASIQIPGEKFALNKDLELEFEGKKTESGKIDPAYCRIIFYLELGNLRETIVDMNIQNRAVSVTIFNDSDTILNQSVALKPMLRDGLSALNYHLSTVSMKPLKQMEVDRNSVSKRTEKNAYQGVDYRV